MEDLAGRELGEANEVQEAVEPESAEQREKPELETIEVFDTHEVLTNQVCCVTLVDIQEEVCSFGKFQV